MLCTERSAHIDDEPRRSDVRNATRPSTQILQLFSHSIALVHNFAQVDLRILKQECKTWVFFVLSEQFLCQINVFFPSVPFRVASTKSPGINGRQTSITPISPILCFTGVPPFISIHTLVNALTSMMFVVSPSERTGTRF